MRLINNIQQSKGAILLVFSLALIFTLSANTTHAQSISKDALNIPCLTANVGFCVPIGDLNSRYNPFGQTGASFMMKFKNNMLLSVEGLVLFGEGYKGEDPLALIVNTDGTITNQYGQPSEYSRGMRGMQLTMKTGYIVSQWGHNPNSGVTFTVGAGLFQSRYWIDQRGNNVPQIMGDYAKGYDKLSNGLALTQFIGYTYFHDKNQWNAFIGVEFTEAWTANRRDWDFALMQKDNSKYNDIMVSIKAGWIVSFIRRESEEIYYY